MSRRGGIPLHTLVDTNATVAVSFAFSHGFRADPGNGTPAIAFEAQRRYTGVVESIDMGVVGSPTVRRIKRLVIDGYPGVALAFSALSDYKLRAMGTARILCQTRATCKEYVTLVEVHVRSPPRSPSPRKTSRYHVMVQQPGDTVPTTLGRRTRVSGGGLKTRKAGPRS